MCGLLIRLVMKINLVHHLFTGTGMMCLLVSWLSHKYALFQNEDFIIPQNSH